MSARNGRSALPTTSSRLKFRSGLNLCTTRRNLAWTTVSKIKGLMHRVYKIGQRHELVTKNPVQHVEMRTKTNYRRYRHHAGTDPHPSSNPFPTLYTTHWSL